MAVKIDLTKVLGSGNNEKKESTSFLPKFVSSRASLESWQTRIPHPLHSPQALRSFIVVALITQALICWRIFFPPGPEYASQPYNVTETVSLITEYYRLLQDLRYLGSDSIAYPPHLGSRAINLTLCHQLGLHPSAIETLLQLPYITPHEDHLNASSGPHNPQELEELHEGEEDWYPGWMTASRDILWHNGHFLDYRNDSHLWVSRDPLHRWRIDFSPSVSFHNAMIEYDALPKSAIPLSFLPGRKYGLSLVLDTSDGRMVVLDTQGGGISDPFLGNFGRANVPRKYRVRRNYYGYKVFARLGNEFLKDLIINTARLDRGYVPGSVRTDEKYTPELCPPAWEQWVRDLYREYGWPQGNKLKDCRYGHLRGKEKKCKKNPLKSFDGKGFDVAMRELRHKIEVQYMLDWYCPVPREQELIDKLKEWRKLTAEQIKFAESDKPRIVEKLEGWAKKLALTQN
jgi:hypothetical protein